MRTAALSCKADNFFEILGCLKQNLKEQLLKCILKIIVKRDCRNMKKNVKLYLIFTILDQFLQNS